MTPRVNPRSAIQYNTGGGGMRFKVGLAPRARILFWFSSCVSYFTYELDHADVGRYTIQYRGGGARATYICNYVCMHVCMDVVYAFVCMYICTICIHDGTS